MVIFSTHNKCFGWEIRNFILLLHALNLRPALHTSDAWWESGLEFQVGIKVCGGSDLILVLLHTTVLPAKNENDIMFCLQTYQGPIIERSRVY